MGIENVSKLNTYGKIRKEAGWPSLNDINNEANKKDIKYKIPSLDDIEDDTNSDSDMSPIFTNKTIGKESDTNQNAGGSGSDVAKDYFESLFSSITSKNKF